jgi:hypothetical protein
LAFQISQHHKIVKNIRLLTCNLTLRLISGEGDLQALSEGATDWLEQWFKERLLWIRVYGILVQYFYELGPSPELSYSEVTKQLQCNEHKLDVLGGEKISCCNQKNDSE